MKWVVTGSNDGPRGRQWNTRFYREMGIFIDGLECLASYHMIITVPEMKSM